jgi:hypothetical protein
MIDKLDNEIEQYYSLVDKKLISNLCKNNNLRNLIKLSTVSDLYIFNKKNKRWHLKNKEKILKECQNIKKKQLKNSSLILSNLAKLNSNYNISNVKDIYTNLHNKISNIDNIIKCLEQVDTNIVNFDDIHQIKTSKELEYKQLSIQKEQTKIINLNKYSQNSSEHFNDFIECYSNC